MQYAPTELIMGVCYTPLRKTDNGKWETETTHEAGTEAKLVLTMPCKKEFFYEVKKTENYNIYERKEEQNFLEDWAGNNA